MSDIDPEIARTTETRTTYTPAGSTITEVRAAPRANRTAWWVSGAVVIVAIVAFAVVYSRQNAPATNDQALAAATQQGASQVDAQDARNAAVIAQSSAQAAQTAAQTSATVARSSAGSAAADSDTSRQGAATSAPADAPPSPNPSPD